MLQQKGSPWGHPRDRVKQSPSARSERKLPVSMSRPSVAAFPNEDASDSDVSTYAPDPRSPHVDPRSTVASPVPIPPLAATPESRDAIEARLQELKRVEEANGFRYEILATKRQRKDDRTRNRRYHEDQQILSARARKDERVRARRAPEDEAFDRVEKAVHDEESVSVRIQNSTLKLISTLGAHLEAEKTQERSTTR